MKIAIPGLSARVCGLFMACAAPVYASHEQPAVFGATLHESFHHARCLTCHQFNSPRSHGYSYTSHRGRYLCETCHLASITALQPGDWFAPPSSKLDYTGLGPKETCEFIKRNFPQDNLKQRMEEHLLYDVRIHWALENGKTPSGQLPTVPGGYAVWKQRVRDWIDDGMRCE